MIVVADESVMDAEELVEKFLRTGSHSHFALYVVPASAGWGTIPSSVNYLQASSR